MQKLFFVAAVLIVPLAAYPHGGGEHIMGTVKAVGDQGLTVATKDKTEAKIAFDANTKFEKDGSASSAKELHVGDRVVVHTAKKDAAGEWLAVLVKFGSEQSNKPGTKHDEAATVIELAVTSDGFTPNRVNVKKGEPVSLVITRTTDKTCATTINVPDYGIQRDLPLNEAVTLTFTPTKAGEINYACAMNMVGGVLIVE